MYGLVVLVGAAVTSRVRPNSTRCTSPMSMSARVFLSILSTLVLISCSCFFTSSWLAASLTSSKPWTWKKGSSSTPLMCESAM